MKAGNAQEVHCRLLGDGAKGGRGNVVIDWCIGLRYPHSFGVTQRQLCFTQVFYEAVVSWTPATKT